MTGREFSWFERRDFRVRPVTAQAWLAITIYVTALRIVLSDFSGANRFAIGAILTLGFVAVIHFTTREGLPWLPRRWNRTKRVTRR